MKSMKFEHDGKKYTIKGEWEKDTFTAQAFAGKKPASDPFHVKKEKVKGGVIADDSDLENIVMEAAKNEVLSGEYNPD
jgi:hypothetical protein